MQQRREKMVIAANKLGTTPEDIEVKSGIRTVYNNQNQQGEQYNNCTVAVPESLLATIQLTLQSLHKALSDSQALNTELQLEIKQLKEGFATFKDQYQKER